MLDQLLSALPLIIAAIVPPLVMGFRNFIAPLVPGRLIPMLLPVAGGLVAGLANLAGVDLGDFNPETADLNAWQQVVTGVLVGLAAIGVHQVGVQAKRDP